MGIHDAYTDEQVAQAVAILQRFSRDRLHDALEEVSRALGRRLNAGALGNLLKRRGYKSPTNYCACSTPAPSPTMRPSTNAVGDAASVGAARRGVGVGHRPQRANVADRQPRTGSVNRPVDNDSVARKPPVDCAVKVPGFGKQSAQLEDKFARLVEAVKRAPKHFEDLCNTLRICPDDCRDLLAQAEAKGIFVDVAQDYVSFRPEEAPNIARVTQLPPAPVVGNKHVIAVASDWHFGSKYQELARLRAFVDHAYDYGARQVMCPGDIVDGLHPKRMHEYSSIGLEAQVNEAIAGLPRKPGLTYHCITGNHDGHYTTRIYSSVGRSIEAQMHAAGRDDVFIYGPARKMLMVGTVKVELWHPALIRNNAYADSYHPQRHIERAYPLGGKPQVLLIGHLHTMFTMHKRGIHAMLAPCFQGIDEHTGEMSEFSKWLGYPPTVGGCLVHWDLTADNTIRRFGFEEETYYPAEKPEQLRGVA